MHKYLGKVSMFTKVLTNPPWLLDLVRFLRLLLGITLECFSGAAWALTIRTYGAWKFPLVVPFALLGDWHRHSMRCWKERLMLVERRRNLRTSFAASKRQNATDDREASQ